MIDDWVLTDSYWRGWLYVYDDIRVFDRLDIFGMIKSAKEWGTPYDPDNP